MGGMGLLVRLGQHLPRRHLPELAVPFEVVGLPDFGDHAEGLFPHFAGVTGVDPHAQLLVGSRPAGTEFDPAVGQLVHHRHPFGHPHRVVVGQDHHAEAEADALGQAAQRPEDDLGTGRLGEGGQEVVFHEPDRIEPHLIGQDALFDGLFNHGVVVQHGPLHLVCQGKFHNKNL